MLQEAIFRTPLSRSLLQDGSLGGVCRAKPLQDACSEELYPVLWGGSDNNNCTVLDFRQQPLQTQHLGGFLGKVPSPSKTTQHTNMVSTISPCSQHSYRARPPCNASTRSPQPLICIKERATTHGGSKPVGAKHGCMHQNWQEYICRDLGGILARSPKCSQL